MGRIARLSSVGITKSNTFFKAFQRNLCVAFFFVEKVKGRRMRRTTGAAVHRFGKDALSFIEMPVYLYSACDMFEYLLKFNGPSIETIRKCHSSTQSAVFYESGRVACTANHAFLKSMLPKWPLGVRSEESSSYTCTSTSWCCGLNQVWPYITERRAERYGRVRVV